MDSLAHAARESCFWPDPILGLFLTRALTEEAKRIARTYTVAKIVNDGPLGSGTPLRIDNPFGILTAKNAVNHPRRRGNQLTYTGYRERILLTSIAKIAHPRSISTNVLGKVKTNGSGDAHRPDLAFCESAQCRE